MQCQDPEFHFALKYFSFLKLTLTFAFSWINLGPNLAVSLHGCISLGKSFHVFEPISLIGNIEMIVCNLHIMKTLELV